MELARFDRLVTEDGDLAADVAQGLDQGRPERQSRA
jgi:hypothetical protein